MSSLVARCSKYVILLKLYRGTFLKMGELHLSFFSVSYQLRYFYFRLLIYSASRQFYIFSKIWFPYFFYNSILCGRIFTISRMFSFYVSTSELNMFSTDLCKIHLLLFVDVSVHSLFQLFELYLHLSCVLVVDLFEFLLLQSLTNVYQKF